jgi:GTP cyclohydrolase I
MVDEKKIKKAAELFLEAIGEDKNREGLKETPERIARMCGELFAPETPLEEIFKKVFSAPENAGAVIEKDIVFYSFCEHHLLPFFGVAHVGYVPDGKVLGLSKIARAVDYFCRRPQIQENLCASIADAFMEHLKPKGVIVALEAEHLCMSMRGVKKPGAKTFTVAARGIYLNDEALRSGFIGGVRR